MKTDFLAFAQKYLIPRSMPLTMPLDSLWYAESSYTDDAAGGRYDERSSEPGDRALVCWEFEGRLAARYFLLRKNDAAAPFCYRAGERDFALYELDAGNGVLRHEEAFYRIRFEGPRCMVMTDFTEFAWGRVECVRYVRMTDFTMP